MITLTLDFVNPCSQKIYADFPDFVERSGHPSIPKTFPLFGWCPFGTNGRMFHIPEVRFRFWFGLPRSHANMPAVHPGAAPCKKTLQPPGTATCRYFFSKKASHNSVSEVVMPSAPAFNAFSTSSRVRINPPAKIGMPSRSFTSVIIHGAMPGKTSI